MWALGARIAAALVTIPCWQCKDLRSSSYSWTLKVKTPKRHHSTCNPFVAFNSFRRKLQGNRNFLGRAPKTWKEFISFPDTTELKISQVTTSKEICKSLGRHSTSTALPHEVVLRSVFAMIYVQTLCASFFKVNIVDNNRLQRIYLFSSLLTTCFQCFYILVSLNYGQILRFS